MARFQFKYEKLLDRYRDTERQRQRELAQLQHQQAALKNQLTRMQRTVDDSKRQMGQDLVGRVDLSRISAVARYSNDLVLRGHELIEQAAAAEEKIEQARERLREARRQRKAMELLRDRHYAQWAAEQRKQERRQQDELATQRFARGETEEVV